MGTQLRLLTSLNLTNNRLANNCFEVISQLTSLRDLKLANNLLYGPLDPSVSNLQNLEIFDIHGNNVSTLPTNFGNLERLRILNLAENSFELLPFGILSQMPLTELNLKKNKLAKTLIEDDMPLTELNLKKNKLVKTLIEDDVEALPKLQSIDISCNQITHIVAPGTTVSLPALYQLSASMNRLKALPDVSSWSSLLTLTADENSISEFPEGFFSLEKLRHVDFSANDIRIIPPEIARMDNLAMIRLSGNPEAGTAASLRRCHKHRAHNRGCHR
ncbi:Leucine-rich repeat-containing protein 39 like [Verticillium longisporum]|nr:Leucine-rich repeat-containing protein 39 like [Verticillium longisporum]